MSALPIPLQDGSLEELWRWLNVTEADRPLLVAALVAALCHDISHPVLAFFGEQGTGKTTAHRMSVSLIDPSPVPTRKPPRDAESWVTAAAGSWVVGLDNLSDIQPWLSDSICRAVTGDGDVRRKLYTDGEHSVFAYKRFVILNSIDLGAVRGDLAERMLPIHLETIPADKRLDEQDLQTEWERLHPRILGALLDITVKVINALPGIDLATRPRMADFSRILAAVDIVMETEGFARYMEQQNAMATDSLTGDPFIMAVQDLGHFDGTSAELLDAVTTPTKPPKSWPADGRAVTQRLKNQAPVMRKAGWSVQDDGGHNKRRVIRWTLDAPTENARNSSSPPLPTGPNGGEAGMAGTKYGQSQGNDPGNWL